MTGIKNNPAVLKENKFMQRLIIKISIHLRTITQLKLTDYMR